MDYSNLNKKKLDTDHFLVGIDIPDYVTVRSRERPGSFREDIIKR